MKRLVACVVLLSLVIWLPAVMQAQEDRSPIDEADYWLLLEQTNLQLLAVMSQDERALAETGKQMSPMWRDISAIRVNDQTITIDTEWIVATLETADKAAWTTLQKRVQALLDYRSLRVRTTEGNSSLAELENVLQDPRFIYDDEPVLPEPTALAPDDSQESVEFGLPAELSQLLLIGLGVLIVVAFLINLGRSLNVTPAQLQTNDNENAEPTNSTQASDVASSFAAAHDYRSAIRYQYLSSLLLLNERGFIRYDSTLTNREHLSQVREQAQLYEPLRRVINAFEDVWYGYSPVDEAFYQQYCQNIDQLQRLMP